MKILLKCLLAIVFLIHPSFGIDGLNKYEQSVPQSRSFKVPSIGKMMMLSLVIMSDPVSSAPWDRTSTRSFAPTPRPFYLTHEGIARYPFSCANECTRMQCGIYGEPFGCTAIPDLPCTIHMPLNGEDCRTANCKIPLTCERCNIAIKGLWREKGYTWDLQLDDELAEG